MFGVLTAVFVAVEIKLGEKALVPPRIFTQRSVLAGVFWTMSTSACMMVMLFYIPIWFQAVKNVDAEQSGIMNLPLVLAMVIGVIFSGIAISKFGYYNPFMFAAVVLLSIGAGLLYTFQVDTGHPKWIGYQVIFGLGLGLGLQQANIAVQTCLAPVDVPVGASLLMFSQQLNGALFVSIAETLFSNFLQQNLEKISGINAAEVIKAGATALREYVPASKLSEVLVEYSDAITKTFILGIVMPVISLFPALAMEWKSVKKDSHKKKKQETGDDKA
jgi:MFS family permease